MRLSSHFSAKTLPSLSLSLTEGFPMAELKEMSKRKRPSVPTSRSLMGIFSRSKSQMHLHRNRSGQYRPESTRGGNHQDLQPFVKKRKSSLPAEDSSVGCDLSSVSVKDLRLRRAFSPSSADGVIPNCLDDTEHLGKSEVAGSCLGGSQVRAKKGEGKERAESYWEILGYCLVEEVFRLSLLQGFNPCTLDRPGVAYCAHLFLRGCKCQSSGLYLHGC